MNRLHKKCLVASAGVHGLLLLILFVGPAFLSSKTQSEDLPILDFYPSKLFDANVSGGGNRNAPRAIPAPAPPPQVTQAQPAPAKVREPDPPKVVLKHELVDPDGFENEPKHRVPQISTKMVTRSKTRPKAKEKSEDADNQAQQQQVLNARKRLARDFAIAAQNISESTSSATSIEEYGPGTGGPAYASYAAWVKTVYENAWQAPEDSATDDAITKVSVTIGRDGTVLSSRIVRPSGDSPVDKSVQRTLDRVSFIAPFPEGAKDKQRTYIINFNLKAKRGLA